MSLSRVLPLLRATRLNFTKAPRGYQNQSAVRRISHLGTPPRPRVSWQSRTRPQVQWKTVFRNAAARQTRAQSGFRRPFNYQRFQQSRGILVRWAQHPRFYYHVAAIGFAVGGVYVFNLEEVPVSHRRRFRIVSYAMEQQMGETMYQQTMAQFRGSILPPHHPAHRLAARVAERLIPHSGLAHDAWEVHVIDSPEKNAFVIPGGKIFVFSGILPVCGDEAGLAAVLGHEIAHNVAHHAAERMSQSFVWLPVAIVASFIVGIDFGIGRLLVDLAFLKPGSRAQESEADYIGLLMMAEACYNPSAAVDMWARMHEEEKGAPPQWISTHPSNYNRMEKIRDWLPQAEDKLDESGCHQAGRHGMFRVTVRVSSVDGC